MPWDASRPVSREPIISTFQLVREQTIPRRVEEVFEFFADAQNLETLTPPWLHFQILTPQPIEMQTGAIIQYRLQLHGLPVHWTTAISQWKPPFEFVDVQLKGPYVLWHHRHRFESIGDETRMTDIVTYRLPMGVLGRLVHACMVRHDLEQIFDFREQVVARIFRVQ